MDRTGLLIKEVEGWEIRENEGREQPYTVWGRNQYGEWHTWRFCESYEKAESWMKTTILLKGV